MRISTILTNLFHRNGSGNSDTYFDDAQVALLNAAESRDEQSISGLLAKVALEHGVNNVGGNRCYSALLNRAVCQGDLKMVITIILSGFQGADLNLKDKTGQTTLMYATDHRDHLCIKTLIMFGANPNIQDGAGLTALM